MGAEIAEVRAAHGQEFALVVERELRFDDEIARLIVAQERLVALDDPFHRAAEFARRPGDSCEFGIDHAAGAEIAADVLHQDAHLVRCNAKHRGEIGLEPDGAAVSGVNRETSRRGVEFGQRGARLHRHAGDALHPGLEPRHMRRARKSRLGRRGIAELGIEADIGRGVMDMRRILPRRRGGLDHGGQHVVIDLDRFGAVFGRIHRLGDHHRDGFADEPRFVGRQWKMRRFERRLAAFVAQLGLRRMRRPRLVRNGLEPVGDDVGAGQHREHAGHGFGLVGCDGAQPRMRMRRTHHDGVDLARQIFIRRIAAAAAHQPQIFAAAHRLADAGTNCRLIHRLLLPSFRIAAPE